MKILILDNYDSFVYNLDYLIRSFGHVPEVYRNDKISLEEVGAYDKILLSPGPGLPDESGILMDLIKTYAPTKSMLGVCLGHQAIGQVFGAELIHLDEVLHGVSSTVHVKNPESVLFREVTDLFKVCHYHSWALSKDSMPAALEVTATNEKGLVMAIRHRSYDLHGVQFHPESYISEHGRKMIGNWLAA